MKPDAARIELVPAPFVAMGRLANAVSLSFCTVKPDPENPMPAIEVLFTEVTAAARLVIEEERPPAPWPNVSADPSAIVFFCTTSG